MARYLGRRSAGEPEEFLPARAMKHDSLSLSFRLACEHLISSQAIRPGVVTLPERVAAARAASGRETHGRARRCGRVRGTGDQADQVAGAGAGAGAGKRVHGVAPACRPSLLPVRS
ncbi:hypothetical protein [Streptosporangium pseudovulgare]|uniref:hypothetical protein n=1 Tax=Streptosporangium pseudovulgare TaxID=35765 RepID=UPI003570A15B